MVVRFVLVGSTHGFIDDFAKQREIIERINPEIVLSEDMEDLRLDSRDKFNEILKKKEISNMTSFSDLKRLIELCFRKNIKLIGIDLKNFGFNDELQKKIKSQERLTNEEEMQVDEIIRKREKKHLESILKYSKQTSKPLVVIVGAWHLRDNSFLRQNLSNCKLILPCDNEGKVMIEPAGDKSNKYVEIESNGITNKN